MSMYEILKDIIELKLGFQQNATKISMIIFSVNLELFTFFLLIFVSPGATSLYLSFPTWKSGYNNGNVLIGLG